MIGEEYGITTLFRILCFNSGNIIVWVGITDQYEEGTWVNSVTKYAQIKNRKI